MLLASLILAAAAAAPATRPAEGFTPLHLDFDADASLELNAVQGGGTLRYHFYTEDGQKFDMPARGAGAEPVLSTEQAASGDTSLKLSTAGNDGTDRDRLELRLKHGRGDEGLGREPFRFGQDRWYGFKIYIDPASAPARPNGRWTHVHQLWQPVKNAGSKPGGWGIPMAVSFKPVAAGEEPSFTLEAVAKSDGRRSQFTLGTLEPGQWHELTFNVMLSHSTDEIDGHFRVWLDGEPTVNETVDIGNTPEVIDELDFKAYDAMDVRFGLYRKQQAGDQTLYLDDVWFDDAPPSDRS
jgi:hypothetical protein